MEEDCGPHRMVFQEGILPLPNGPKATDWLPGFAGFSWLAYGAHHQLAVSSAPSTTDTEETATGRFFQQILDLDDRDREWVKAVSWSPQVPSLGILAAVAGNNIHIFGPKSLSRLQSTASLTGLPFAWEKWELLRHPFQVCTFGWTQSGDGLMAAGSEIMMWQHQACDLRNWTCIWRVKVEQPQHLCAATFSAMGFVATANGTPAHENESLAVCINSEDKTQSNSKDKASIWSWEDGSAVQEVELMHPQQVMMLQWRPSKASLQNVDQDFPQIQRPILLTTCSDGAVRLWLEVDSGRARLDRAAGRESADKRSRAAFFVSAVIEVNRNLYGQLGHNIFVVWATDIVVKAFGAASKSSGSSQAYVRRDIAPCEWLVGMGPNGSISLWSLHCLDDISPPRCPRILLWEHGYNLVPDHPDPSFLKAIVQRPEDTLAEPPSSLDVFEILKGGHFRWLRIWPPVSAIGRGGSKVALLGSEAPSISRPASPLSPGKKSSWSVACEDLHVHGHSDEIFSLAVHPCISTQLAASVDRTGTILVWLLGSCLEPQFEIENFLAPFWKLGAHLSGHRIPTEVRMDLLAWAPIVFPGGETCLLVANLDGVSCLLLSKEVASFKAKPEIVRVASRHICNLPWATTDGQGLEGIYNVPTASFWDDNCRQTKFTVLGIGNNGTLIVGWQLLFTVSADGDVTTQPDQDIVGPKHFNKCKSFKILAAQPGPPSVLHVDWKFIGSLNLEIVQRVISVASPAPRCTVVDADMTRTLGRPCSAWHVVTGGADGIVRFWQIASQRHYDNEENEKSCFECVGLLKAGDERITSISVANSGGRVATSSKLTLQDFHSVCIWQAESLNSYGQYRLEDQLLLPSAVLALTWLEEGSGLSVLAVALQDKVEVYVQRKTTSAKSTKKHRPGLNGWICITSAVLDWTPDSIAWGPCATLLVASGSHIWVSGLRTSIQSKQILCDKEVGKLGSTFSSSSPSLSTYSGVRKLDKVISRAASYNTLLDVSKEGMTPETGQDTVSTPSASVQALGGSLPDYHPMKILWYLTKGDKRYARACVRHLLHHLVANASATVNECSPSSATFQEQKIPLLGLKDLLERDGDVALPEAANCNSSYSVRSNMKASNEKYAFLDTRLLMNDSWKAEQGLSHGTCNHVVGDDHIKTGGRENLTKLESDAVLHALEQCCKVPGLVDGEKAQLLAAIDTLAEMDGVIGNTQVALLDTPGQRFWVAARYSHHEHIRKARESVNAAHPTIESKAMAWALQSESKDVILDLCLAKQASWSDMRALGLGFWYTDAVLLRKRIEKVARGQFLGKKDPKECMLLYLALDRRSVLTGLFKLSQNEQDKHLYEFLVRDFKDEKNRGAALKNAYVLMGKHRHELAASFFLLGGDIASAVSVCIKNLGDPQLGLVICRLLEGEDGSVGSDVMKKQLIPAARLASDYWLASLLQWLLGCKLEAMQELTRSHAVPSGSSETLHSVYDEEAGMFYPTETSNFLLFDADIGDFCTMLMSKCRLQSGAFLVEASRTLRHALWLTTSALSKAGLPLQALEQLEFYSMHTSSNLKRTFSLATTEAEGCGVEPYVDESLRAFERVKNGNVGTGWMSRHALRSVEEATGSNLALQCAAQLLKDHPFWLTGILTWTQLIKSLETQIQAADSDGSGNKCVAATNESGSGDVAFNTIHHLIKKADKLLDENFWLLARRFSVDLFRIFSELVSLSCNFHRPYALCRLRSAAESASTNVNRFPSFASRTALPLIAVQCMKAVCKDAPWVLARAVLACGGHVAPLQHNSGQHKCCSKLEKLVQSAGSQIPEGGVLPWPQLQTLIQFSMEIMILSTALETETNAGEAEDNMTNMINVKKIRQVTILLAYVLSVAAAWLGRRAKALLLLVGPTIKDASSPPEHLLVQFDAAAWGQQTEIIEPVTPAGASTSSATHIEEDDVWRVLGVSLWSHILSYTKKQLSGTTKEASYSSYGRVSQSHLRVQTPPKDQFGSKSPVRSPPSTPASGKGFNSFGWVLPHASPTSKVQATVRAVGKLAAHSPELLLSDEEGSRTADLKPTLISAESSSDSGMPLISSLACIAAGLRTQLASHVGNTLEVATYNPLLIWLWGKPLQLAPGSTGALSSSSHGVVPEQFASMPRLEVADKGACTELWKLLVTRDKVLSALSLQGVVGPRYALYREPCMPEKKCFGPGPGSSAGTSTRSGSSSVLKDDGRPSGNGKMTGDATKNHSHLGISTNGVVDQSVRSPDRPQVKSLFGFQAPEEILHLSGELFEAICVNSCDPQQAAVASNHKGIIYLDLKSHSTYLHCKDNLWGEADWPKNGWAGSISTPVPVIDATSLGFGSKFGTRLGVGGSTASLAAVVKSGKDIGRGVGFGIPGYAGMGAWGWGWEEWEDGVVDPPATVENVHTKAMAAHPLRPLFLVGSDNTHVYLWEFGKALATATYGVLPGTNVPPLYVIPSVSAVEFDRCGHRFASAALDGSVSIWQLEVGGRSNVCPTDSRMCFSRLASDVAFLGASGSILATTGATQNGDNLVIWDTLAPPNASRAVSCHEGGARCISMFDNGVGGSSSVPLLVTGGKAGDIAVHDFRYIAGGKAKRHRAAARDPLNSPTTQYSAKPGDNVGRKQGQQGKAGMSWYLPHAHSGGVARIVTVPGTSLFISASKDGDVKLWDVNTCELVDHWPKVHDRHMFLRHNSTGFGAIHAAVTDLQVLDVGFLTCGADGIVKLFRHQTVSHAGYGA